VGVWRTPGLTARERPAAQVLTDPGDHPGLGDEPHAAHRLATAGTAQWVHFEDPPQQLRPSPAGLRERWWRGPAGCGPEARGGRRHLGPAPAAAAGATCFFKVGPTSANRVIHVGMLRRPADWRKVRPYLKPAYELTVREDKSRQEDARRRPTDNHR
jgi:hypothetical protein